MKNKVIIVTGADEAYAALADDLFASFEPHWVELVFDVGLLDLGLEEESRERLGATATSVVVPPWPFKPHAEIPS